MHVCLLLPSKFTFSSVRLVASNFDRFSSRNGMKASIAITLIIMGSFLIAAPILADYLQRAQVVELLRGAGAERVSLGAELSEAYRFGCWMVGALMVGAAIFASRDGRPRSA
jgi:hypothetical protein